MTIRYSAQNTSLDDLCPDIEREGYAIVENAITPELLGDLRAELDPFFRDAYQGHDEFMGNKTVRFGSLLEKSTAVQSLIAHPLVLEVAERILSPYCVNFHIHYTGVMQLKPGQGAQVLHRDTGVFPVANPSPPLTVATMWALDDFTAENGATVLFPGSHLWDDARNPRKSERLFAEMPAGSVLIYTGKVFHGGGHNASEADRTGLAIHYGLGWLRQEENQFLACSAETARKLPESIQKLLGYELGAPSLGFVDHIHPRDHLHGVRDPAESNVASEDLRDRAHALKRLAIQEKAAARSRFYEIDD